MFPPDVLLAYVAAVLVVVVAPGPDNILAIGRGLSQGPLAAALSSVGAGIGIMVHTLAATLGLSLVLQASPWAFWVVKGVGAAYLLWLAWLSFRAGASLALTGGSGAPFPGYAALYRRGIVMNVTNPKVSLFFLAFLPQFCDPTRGSMALQVLSLGLLFMLATLAVFFSVALLGGRLALWFNKSPGGQILIHRAAGLVFVGLALLLLLSGK